MTFKYLLLTQIWKPSYLFSDMSFSLHPNQYLPMDLG